MNKLNHFQHQADLVGLLLKRARLMVWLIEQQESVEFVDLDALAINSCYQQYSEEYDLTLRSINRVRDAHASRVVSDAHKPSSPTCPYVSIILKIVVNISSKLLQN